MRRTSDLINLLALGVPRRLQLGKLERLLAQAQRSASAGPRMQAISEYGECLEMARSLDRWDIVLYVRMISAGLLMRMHDYSKARLHYTEAINISRNLKALESVAHARYGLASVASLMGDYALTERLCEECQQYFKTSGDTDSLAGIHMIRSQAAETISEARTHLSEALALFEAAQSRSGTLVALCSLGHEAVPGRDNSTERSYLDRCLAMCDVDNESDARTQAYALNNLANIDRYDGELHTAAKRYAESLKLKQELADEWAISYSLDGCAAVASRWSRHQDAARMYGLAAAIRKRLSTPLERSRLSLYREEVDEARRLCGDEAFEIWWREGEQMSVDEGIKLAAALQS